MAPAIAHAVLLFALSAQPELRVADDPALDLVARKLGHGAAYALLAMLLLWGLGGVGDRRRDVTVLVAVAAYAISDEIHQAFVPGRGPSVMDVGIDIAGGAAGLLLVRTIHDAGAGPPSA